VLGGLAAVVTTAGCSASGPECAATEPVAAAELPPVLRSAGGDWYGTDDLWVAVPDWPAARTEADGLVLKHAWVTLDGEGQLTAAKGPPQLAAERLDADGRAEASTGGYATDARLSWWPAVFRFPASGCWAEYGTLGETQVRLVLDVEAAADPGAG
jgi:hypothetical protein